MERGSLEKEKNDGERDRIKERLAVREKNEKSGREEIEKADRETKKPGDGRNGENEFPHKFSLIVYYI